jgi:alginate O-acetyltransferase complex protein AlgI
MVFSSAIFIFFFLPFVLLIIILARKELKNLFLMLTSLFFYAWGEKQYVLLMLVFILFNYLFGIGIDACLTKRNKKIVLTLGVVFNLSLLIFYKYKNFLIDNINILSTWLPFNPIFNDPIKLPLGISFFTFHCISYVVDIYKEKVPAQKNPVDFALYVSFFPQQIAGPIVRYVDVAKEIIDRNMKVELFTTGIKRFIIGLAKKVLLANTLGEVADKIFDLPINELNSSVSWLGIICYTLQIYFDFSGYSDMAIGLGKMFGLNFLENFNLPYTTKSVTEFWRRWHISLSTWFRDYVYIPLGGNQKGNFRTYLNLILVFFLTGLWHGSAWNFVVWGMLHGSFIILERIGLKKILDKIWPPISHFYLIAVIVVTWVFFRCENLTTSIQYIERMFSLNNAYSDIYTFSELANHQTLFYIFMGISTAAGLIHYIKSSLSEFNNNLFNSNLYKCAVLSTHLLIFILALSYVAKNTYNPFIYYRF